MKFYCSRPVFRNEINWVTESHDRQFTIYLDGAYLAVAFPRFQFDLLQSYVYLISWYPYHAGSIFLLKFRLMSDGLGSTTYGEDEGEFGRNNRRPFRKEREGKVHDSIIEERIQRERPCRTLFIRNIKASCAWNILSSSGLPS